MEGFTVGANVSQARFSAENTSDSTKHPLAGLELQYLWQHSFVSASYNGAIGDDKDDTDTIKVSIDQAYSAFVGAQGFIDDRVLLQLGIGYGGTNITTTTLATGIEVEETFGGFAGRIRGMESLGTNEQVLFSLDYTHYFNDDDNVLSGANLGLHYLF